MGSLDQLANGPKLHDPQGMLRARGVVTASIEFVPYVATYHHSH